MRFPFPFFLVALLVSLFSFPFSCSDPCFGFGGVEEGGGFVVVGGSAQMGVGWAPWGGFGKVLRVLILPVFPLPAKILPPTFLFRCFGTSLPSYPRIKKVAWQSCEIYMCA